MKRVFLSLFMAMIMFVSGCSKDNNQIEGVYEFDKIKIMLGDSDNFTTSCEQSVEEDLYESYCKNNDFIEIEIEVKKDKLILKQKGIEKEYDYELSNDEFIVEGVSDSDLSMEDGNIVMSVSAVENVHSPYKIYFKKK